MPAITAVIGPKNNPHKLNKIDLPSNIIPSKSTNGYIIPSTDASPNNKPWSIFPVILSLSEYLSRNPDSKLRDISNDKLYINSTGINKNTFFILLNKLKSKYKVFFNRINTKNISIQQI